MKLTELAEKAGVPYKRLHAYVRMGQEPPLEVVVKVADALGVSVDYLLGRVDQTNQLLPEEEKFAADVKFIRRAYKEMSEKERKKGAVPAGGDALGRSQPGRKER
jgi:transcriptional regulator with XRE-family HTH domain